MHRLQELVRLHRMGTGAREVARLIGLSPNTERKYRRALAQANLLQGDQDVLPPLQELLAAIRDQHPVTPATREQHSSIAAWAPKVGEFLSKGLSARPIYDRLRLEDEEFTGSYWAVKRMVQRMRIAEGVRAEDVAIPVDTAPGDVAQVDFGYVGKLICPETHVAKKAWVFVMTLGFSRHMYAEVVFNQKVETWLALHVRAFDSFGGVPATVVPDNLKAAVIRAAFSVDGDCALNRSYRELARYYGFKVDPAPPRAPKKKGKVESAVKYVKRNALAGRDGESIDEVNRDLVRWVEQIAGSRNHGTTGRAPLSVFLEEEQPHLQPLPSERYETVLWRKATVHQDAHIAFDGGLYSVPWRWVGHEIWVRATPKTVTIQLKDEEVIDEQRIASHRRLPGRGRSTIESHLPEHRRDLRHRSRSYWQERAEAIGPQTLRFVTEVFESDEVLSQLRKVQAIVTHLEGFPADRAEAASARAAFYGTYSYKGVKLILARALDFEPLPLVVVAPSVRGGPPRFARDIGDLIASKLEAPREPN